MHSLGCCLLGFWDVFLSSWYGSEPVRFERPLGSVATGEAHARLVRVPPCYVVSLVSACLPYLPCLPCVSACLPSCSAFQCVPPWRTTLLRAVRSTQAYHTAPTSAFHPGVPHCHEMCVPPWHTTLLRPVRSTPPHNTAPTSAFHPGAPHCFDQSVPPWRTTLPRPVRSTLVTSFWRM